MFHIFRTKIGCKMNVILFILLSLKLEFVENLFVLTFDINCILLSQKGTFEHFS